MSEDLFRLCVIRPPLTPDPRYPPILLGQQSPFQEGLGRAVSDDPNNPRKGLEDGSNTYVKSAEFTGIDETNANNLALEKAARAITDLVDQEPEAAPDTPDDSEGDPNPATPTLPVNHGELTTKLKDAFAVQELGGLSAWFDPLQTRLKDSIVALRLLGVESETGNLAVLTQRVRTIEVVRKLLSDQNFPFDAVDLQKYFLRPLLAPNFAELKSIFSTAAERLAAEGVAEANRKAAQDRINRLFQDRSRVVAALKDVVRLPRDFRQVIAPRPFAPIAPAVDLTRINLATQHLNLMQNLSSLTLKSFERGLQPVSPSPIPRGDTTGGGESDARLTADATLAQVSAIANPLVNMSKTLLDTFKEISSQPAATPALEPIKQTPFALIPSALDNLSPDTTSVFNKLNIQATKRPVDMTVQTLRQELGANALALDEEYRPYSSNIAKVSYFGGVKVISQKPDRSRWAGAFLGGKNAPDILAPPLSILYRLSGRVTILGVADLLVVKQQLVGYEGGDVAYIENVLKGETKSREVAVVTSMETEMTSEVETTESKETDTTTAERFEISNESQKAIKEDASTKAGVTVSASYGPTVSISANASFSNDRSKTEATKTASRYGKDITTKAVEKIAKRVLQRTVTKTRTETSTKDTHALTNAGGPHISGIYQWLNKVYEAQTWNYGKRTMLDFMIPEPGAFYLDKQTDPDDSASTIVTVPEFNASPLDITAENYIGTGVQYGIADLEPHPPEMSRAVAAYAAGKDQPHAKADKVTIPAGFQVSGITVTASGVSQLEKDQNWVSVTCGSFQWAWNPKDVVIGTVTVTTDYLLFKTRNVSNIVGQGDKSDVGVATGEDLRQEQGEIPWSVTAAHMENFTVTIEVFLECTEEARRNWRNKTWARIKTAADTKIADQNAAIDRAKYNSAFQGRNPEKNKVIMRDEMKKNCISIMMDTHFDTFGAIQTARTKQVPGDLPMSEINLAKALDQGPVVRFFEQAFEWNEMTWILYPYFWGRKDHWYRRVDYEDEDPEFEKFIQSGFARANVPVRPGFEGGLEHYLNTGKVWMGGALPGISSPMFLPLAMEIQESLGKKAEEPKKYGDPWTVKVPTNLIRLRKDDRAPEWKKDRVTGEWVAVKDLEPPATVRPAGERRDGLRALTEGDGGERREEAMKALPPAEERGQGEDAASRLKELQGVRA